MIVQAAALHSEAEIIARYRQAQPARPPAKVIVLPKRMAQIKPDADQHVIAYRQWQKMYSPGTMPSEFIRLACQVMGAEHALIMSHRRYVWLVKVRYDIILMTHDRYPSLSSPKLGILFNRDHTVILHALHTDGRARKNTAKLTPDQVREIRQRYSTGKEMVKDIAKEYRVSPSAISNIVCRRVWRNVD